VSSSPVAFHAAEVVEDTPS